MTTLHLKKSIDRSPLRWAFPVVLLALGLFALSPTARAVDPPPDEGHANQNNTTGDLNTANGADTLCNMMMLGNTPYGCHALESTMGLHNTAIGFMALSCNTGSDNIAVGWLAGTYHMAGSNNIYIGNAGRMEP